MQYDYRLESLSAIFAEHADRADKCQEDLVKQYREDYPHTPLPDHFKDGFNIARALSVMACELEKLKNKTN